MRDLEKDTYEAIQNEMEGKLKPDWSEIKRSPAMETTLLQAFQNLQPYFLTGNMDKDEVVDHLSNYLRIKCSELFFEQITKALKPTLYPIFKDKNQGSVSLSLREKFIIFAQYYHENAIEEGSKADSSKQDSRDWTSKQIQKLFGSNPLFTHIGESQVQKLPNQDKYLSWNVELDVICVFSSMERKFYKTPDKTNAVALLKLEETFYLIIATSENLNICNLNTNPNETVIIEPEVAIDSDAVSEASDADNDDENEDGEDNEEGSTQKKKADQAEKNFSFKAHTLHFELLQTLGQTFYLSSSGNKIMTVSNNGQVEFFEATQISQDSSLKLECISSFKLEGELKEVQMDFKRNLLISRTEKDLHIYNMKEGEKNPEPFYRLEGVQSFKWNGFNKMLLINQSDLYQFCESESILLRQFSKKLGQTVLLARKGILHGSKEGLRFISYSKDHDSYTIRLPQDKTALKKADEISSHAAGKGCDRYSQGFKYLSDYQIGNGHFKGSSVESIDFLNTEDDSVIVAKIHHKFEREFEYPIFNDYYCVGSRNSTISTTVKTERILEIEEFI